MHILDKDGKDRVDFISTRPILIQSCETGERVLFDGSQRDFEHGVLMVLCPEPGDAGECPHCKGTGRIVNEEIDPTIYISDEVRAFVLKHKEEGY